MSTTPLEPAANAHSTYTVHKREQAQVDKGGTAGYRTAQNASLLRRISRSKGTM